MPLRILLGLIGLFHLAVGLVMIGDAEAWYLATPGVSQTGPMNHHFIVDIGLAFLASGAGMLAGFRMGRTTATFALAGAIWPALHAAFHVSAWFSDGLPRDSLTAATELLGVVLIGLVGLALALIRAREEGAI
jgi:hypothetical protein